MDEIVVTGKTYLSSKKAAKTYHYATDYIGQLCRAGKVDCQRFGRAWYVNADSLTEYAGTTDESLKNTAQNLVSSAKIVEESQAHDMGLGVRKPNLIHSIHALHLTARPSLSTWSEIRYSHDDSEILPHLQVEKRLEEVREQEPIQKEKASELPVKLSGEIISRIDEKPFIKRTNLEQIEIDEPLHADKDQPVNLVVSLPVQDFKLNAPKKRKKSALKGVRLALAMSILLIVAISGLVLSLESTVSYSQSRFLAASTIEAAPIPFEELATTAVSYLSDLISRLPEILNDFIVFLVELQRNIIESL
jgi:hypothetical protein